MVDLKKTIDRLYDFLDEDCAGEKVKSLDDYFFNALYSQFEKGDLSVNGVYFTGSEMAGRLIKFSGRNIDKPFVVYDPACGAGDLLESVIADWQVKKTLSETLNFWEDYIYGNDINQDFVDATKIRIAISAIKNGAAVDVDLRSVSRVYFKNIRLGNALDSSEGYRKADLIIVNPPFHSQDVHQNSRFKKGKVNSAALFLEKAAAEAAEWTSILAILPDVIRSGTRYKLIRDIVNNRWRGQIEPVGRFNKHADVDVFFMHGQPKGVGAGKLFSTDEETDDALGDVCDVSVGSVVPHRHAESGKEVAYICARSIRIGEVKKIIQNKRRFSGALFNPPFVVVRRTSSPRDRRRAASSVVLGKRAVAVENHLIVIKPKSGLSSDCIKLMDYLHSDLVNNYLNEVICCRHLTVQAIKKIPMVAL